MSWENILKQIDEVEAIFGKVYWIDGGPSVETKDINKINQVEQNLQKFRTEVISRLINFIKGIQKFDIPENFWGSHTGAGLKSLDELLNDLESFDKLIDYHIEELMYAVEKIHEVRNELEYERYMADDF